jgi:hypothetical protein
MQANGAAPSLGLVGTGGIACDRGCVMRRALLAFLIFPAAAMAALPPANNEAPAASLAAPLGHVAVRGARAALAISPLPPDLVALLPPWRAALRAALLRSGLFRAGSAPPLSVTARVLEFARRGNALTVFTRHELYRPTSAAPVFLADIMIDTGVTSTVSGINPQAAAVGVTRDRRQVARAMRASVAAFVDRLEGFVRRHDRRFAEAGGSGR